MRIRWRGLELPNQVVRDKESGTDFYGMFMIEPFERGFGITVGNSLRRILLSSLEGAAVTHVKIAGAAHEFTSLPGVLEDVTDIVLNIKGLAVELNGEGPGAMKLQCNSKGEVFARDIELDYNTCIINQDHHIATLTDEMDFSIEMMIEKGRGWEAADEHPPKELELGVFPVDSSFSPVTRVRYRTEETRVGQRVNYDRLIMEIWTNGTITPEDALVEAAKILRKHLNPFILYNELGVEQIDEALPEAAITSSTIDAELQAKLDMKSSELNLSVRANNCLDSARVRTVGELVACTEQDLLRVRSFGNTSLREVKRKLEELGLSLGMDIPSVSKPAPAIEEHLPVTPVIDHKSILPPTPMPRESLEPPANTNPFVDPHKIS